MMNLSNIIPPELANHLWQSTLFAAVAASLAFALRKNRAHTRYALWLVASVKFLVPFALFVALGNHLPWPQAAAVARPAIATAVKQIAAPFAASEVLLPISKSGGAFAIGGSAAMLLFGVWISGFFSLLLVWLRRWLRVLAAVRSSRPLALGTAIQVLSTATLLEPGIFGVIAPVLLLPEGIMDHLTPAQLQAIVAHELCHVRRRDNLAAAIHMLVEAIFWFHPLVWWIGSRLVEERERACDEEVLQLGNQPRIYAESILKTCEFYLQSPLACVSGVTGSDLKRRIVHIMTEGFAARLNLRQKLLLLATGITAVAAPIAFGVGSQTLPPDLNAVTRLTFEVASIRPANPSIRAGMLIQMTKSRYVAKGMTVKSMLENAYALHDFQIAGGPAWLNSAEYDVTGKVPEEDAFQYQTFHLRLQSLLADRFNLKFHITTKAMPIYALAVARFGAKMPRASNETADLSLLNPGELKANTVSMESLAANLSNMVGRIVQDKTGLAGLYSVDLKWTPDDEALLPGEVAPLRDPDRPSLFIALKEQLGLKLEAQKGPVPVYVIDNVDRPSEN